MPEGLLNVIALLVLGYLLLLTELFAPGLVLGTLGLASVAYGCYLAFELGTQWGVGAIIFSFAVTGGGLAVFFRSGAARKLVLSSQEAATWKSQAEGLESLLGKEGKTLSKLRPAGMAEIEGHRVDVVANSEFLDEGIRVKVRDVEGNRVVVEAVETAMEGS